MRKRILRFSLITISVLVQVGLIFCLATWFNGCASLGIETKEKQFLVVQKEVNSALTSYKIALERQDETTQTAWHEKYDTPIKGMSAALDAWQEVVMGLTGEAGQLAEFQRIKNELILLGWNYFKGGE